MSLFLHEDVKQLLYNKFVVIIGDSVHRGIYKDLIALLQGNQFLCKKDLKVKGEETFMNDRLIEGGTKGVMTNGINYREVRQYLTDTHLIRFYFVTRVHNSYWREVIFRDLSGDPRPDVIIMNSCLWDISRYGPSGMQQYKENLEKTFQTLASIVAENCICIWNTALPVANKIRGGFLLPELSSLCDTLRLDVLEGNFYARQLAAVYDIYVLDLNYFFRSLMAMQVPDGVHWNFRAHRRFTNILLSHLANIWNVKLPYRKDVDSKLQQQKKVKLRPPKQTNHQNNPAPIVNDSSRFQYPQAPLASHQVPLNQLYTSFSQNEAQQKPIVQPSLGSSYHHSPYVWHSGAQGYAHTPYVAGQSYRWQNPSRAGPYQQRYHPSLQQEYSHQMTYYSDQRTGPQDHNRYHWYPDGNTRRQQRIMADRHQEVLGAMINYASSQYRVQ